MTLVRTHYIIDLVTGLIMAHYCFMMAEWVSYYIDVLIIGVPAKDRMNNYYSPCQCCGWSNKCAN